MFLGRTPCVAPSDVLHPGHLPPASTALVPHPSRKHDLRAAPAGSGLPPVAVTGRRRPGPLVPFLSSLHLICPLPATPPAPTPAPSAASAVLTPRPLLLVSRHNSRPAAQNP